MWPQEKCHTLSFYDELKRTENTMVGWPTVTLSYALKMVTMETQIIAR